VKIHLGLLENDRQELTMSVSEKVDKLQDLEVDLAAMEKKKEEKEEEEAVEGINRDPIDWMNKEKACAQLRVQLPEVENWGIELLWEIMDEVRKDPEGMDIKKLHADAMSSLEAIANSYVVAAGGSGVTMYSLVMKKWMKLISVARKQSLEKIKSELRATRGRNELLVEVEAGLKERIAGQKEQIAEFDESALAKQVKEMKISTEKAKRNSESHAIALGNSEGDLAALKQQAGNDKKALEQVTKKLQRAEETVKKYEEDVEQPDRLNAATLAQVKLLRDQLSDQVAQLSSQSTLNMENAMKYMTTKFGEQEANVAAIVEHQTGVLCDENSARQERTENLLVSFSHDMQGAFRVGKQRHGVITAEERDRQAENLRAVQQNTEEDKRATGKLRVQGTALLRIGKQKEKMDEVRALYMGFNVWAQYAAMELGRDAVFGRLNGSKREQEDGTLTYLLQPH
jgi:hypothetical protein